ncbi:prepilin-type N-terminal cleavage/methylation domain-containing protein [Niveibacterium terrae]|uniref:prepilin-type N-terminal cleavage/methylation domain-containing protein n=1 Tax=Niveibacterium terrae TaxID=3373598 RepID=UPI003A932B9A
MIARGFTLIEVMVVLVILGITSAAVSFSITGLQSRQTEQEMDRLRLVLETAGERAAVTGTPIAAEFLPGRYRFSTLDTDGHWRPIVGDDPLAERPLPDDLSWVSLSINNQPPVSDPPLIFNSEMPRFELHLRGPDGEREYRSRADGSVEMKIVPINGASS